MQRATVINLCSGLQKVVAAEPMFDKDEGVLILQFPDGTARYFNWDHVTDYYYLTEEEFAEAREELGATDDE